MDRDELIETLKTSFIGYSIKLPKSEDKNNSVDVYSGETKLYAFRINRRDPLYAYSLMTRNRINNHLPKDVLYEEKSSWELNHYYRGNSLEDLINFVIQ